MKANPTIVENLGNDTANKNPRKLNLLQLVGIPCAACLIIGVIIWQAITSNGVPDPESPNISPTAAIVNTGILVFREGLEAILVLAALTVSLIKRKEIFWKPIVIGACLSFLATIATWFVAIAAIDSIDASALDIQAATGLLAIVVLMVIMNWFFHSVYWSGWIGMHNRRKKSLTESTGKSASSIYRGLLILGFTSVYREGFEVVLFLQNLRLRAGNQVVYQGAAIGVVLTAVVAYLMFVLHYRMPYKKMLVLTGILLGAVMLIMVGESVQEMQLARWISETPVNLAIPDWCNTWFAVFPTYESLGAQALAATVIIGSFFAARARPHRLEPPSVTAETEINEWQKENPAREVTSRAA